MNATGKDRGEQLCFTFDTVITPRPDGSYVLRPGTLRKHSRRVDVRGIMQRTGLGKRQAQRLACELGAEQRRPGCKLFVSAEALERHLDRRAGGIAEKE